MAPPDQEKQQSNPPSGSAPAGLANAMAQRTAAGEAAGHIYKPDDDPETMELPEASKQKQELQERLIKEVETRRKLRTTVVPTNDADVRSLLRQLEEPITLFGEREMERRERLRKLLATKDAEARLEVPELEEPEAEQQVQKELFYTEGVQELREARLAIAQFSLLRAAERILGAKRKRDSPDTDIAAERAGAEEALSQQVNQSSEIADERPVSCCAYSPDGAFLASAAWSGLVKLWSMPDCRKELTIKAHDDRITGVAWHPDAKSMALDDAAGARQAVALATGSADTTARLWSRSGTMLSALAGHTDRLGRVAFHPAGLHFGTASFDGTWRLWDVSSGACLLEQEGHSRAVYALAFQGDGSLAATGGLDSVARVWDLRTGRSVMVLEGHVKGVMAVDFHPDGFRAATGAQDHTARLWDLRKRRSLRTLPAHTSLVSQVRFEPTDGHALLTCGYDNVAKLWASSGVRLLATLAGHEGKVMGGDICPDGSGSIATVGYDRTLKLWAPDSLV